MRSAVQPKLKKSKFKKGDQVMVISGKSKGKTGEVLRIDLSRSMVLVKDCNVQMRHTKPRRQGESGGIIPQEGAIHFSNVLQLCETCSRGVRKLCEKPAECRYNKKNQ